MYGTRQHVCAQLEEGFSADTPLALLIWTADDMAAFAEGWDLSLNDEEVKAVLAKIGAIDDHHLNGVGADLAGNLLNEVKDELHQVTLPASLLTRVVTLAEQAIWPKEWQSRDENREIPEGMQHKLNDLIQIRKLLQS